MSESRHQRLMVLFDELCDLPVDEKRTRLDALRGEDPKLATDLGAMLMADEDGVSRLDKPPDALAETYVPLVPTPIPQSLADGTPKQIGEYKIIRQLGSGGMGVVYEAEQELPNRRVAIKLIREDVATLSLRNRFVAESHILARLNHPGIAQIYDAASTGPLLYLVMELVEGEPLTVHAERRRLNVRGRVELLALVCDALAHAHQKGVIHRDLKPANILVAGDGQPKVLDFGIARVVANDSRDGRETLAGQLLGTPAYMSPEQTSFEAGELDLRSDVYALGVIGYELMTGRLPHDLHGKQVLEVLRIIREVPPLLLGRVRPELRGDLETIFGKALALEAGDRYQSASAFADDLRRFLADEPIAARPPSILYQVGKWAQRRRGLAAALAALALTVTAGVVSVVVLYFQVDAARRNAEAARAIAEKAEQTADEARARAERESERLAERTDALILVDARAHLDEDPTLTVARLKALGEGAREALPSEGRSEAKPLSKTWHEAALLVAEARTRGVARDVLVGHTGEIEDIEFSPSSKLLATGSKDRTLRIWDFASRTSTVVRGHAGEVQAIAYSPDGGRLASGDSDGEVRVWDARGARVGDARHGAAVSAVAWAPDGSWFTTAHATGEILRWSREGAPLSRKQVVSGSIEQIVVSPDGRFVAVAPEEQNAIGLYDVSRDAVTSLVGHSQPLARVRFLPDGTLVSAGIDGTIRRWQGGQSRLLVRGAGELKQLRVSPDGRTLLWADRLGTIGLHTDKGDQRLATLGGVVRDVALSPRGDLVVTGGDDNALRLFSTSGELRRQFRGHRGRIPRVAFSPDGELVASVSDDHTIRLWPTTAGDRGVIVDPPEARTVVFAPHRPIVAAAALDHTVWLYDLAGGTPVRLEGAADVVYETTFSPDGTHLAVAARDKAVRVYDLAGRLVATLPTPGRATRGAYSATGFVAAAAHASEVPILEVRTGRVRLLPGHSGRVNDVAFSPDGRRLLSGSDDGTLRLFDPASGTGTFLGGPGGRVVEVTFVGDRAVGGTATGKLWARDPANQAAVETPGHEAIVRALVPTAEGGLVSTSDDGNVRAWRPLFVSVGRSGAGHSGPVIAAAVGPDGSAWTGGEDGRVLRWTRDLGGAPKLYLKAAGPVVAIAVSGDGAWVAVASEQGPLRVLPTDIDERASEIRKLLEEMTVATFGHGDVLAGPWQ